MEESGFIRLVHEEANSTSERVSIRRPWRVLGAAALLSVFFVAMVALGREAFRDGMSSSLRITRRELQCQWRGMKRLTRTRTLLKKLCWTAGWPGVDQARWRPSHPSLLRRRVGTDAEAFGPIGEFLQGLDLVSEGVRRRDELLAGNDNLHALTLSGARLRVVLVDTSNRTRYAEYSTFSVADEAENFRVIFQEYMRQCREETR